MYTSKSLLSKNLTIAYLLSCVHEFNYKSMTKKQQLIELPTIIGCTAESRPLTFRLPKKLEEYVLKQPKRSAWLREAVQEKMERDVRRGR